MKKLLILFLISLGLVGCVPSDKVIVSKQDLKELAIGCYTMGYSYGDAGIDEEIGINKLTEILNNSI